MRGNRQHIQRLEVFKRLVRISHFLKPSKAA
jgi:hypothetical protein